MDTGTWCGCLGVVLHVLASDRSEETAMKFINRRALALTLGIAAITLAPLAQAQPDRYDALADSPMAENRPTPETSQLLKDELLFQRATQTYLWALPLIN